MRRASPRRRIIEARRGGQARRGIAFRHNLVRECTFQIVIIVGLHVMNEPVVETREEKQERLRLKALDAEHAMQEYRNEEAATEAKTIRLRALRLAKEEVDRQAAADAPPPPPKAKKPRRITVK